MYLPEDAYCTQESKDEYEEVKASNRVCLVSVRAAPFQQTASSTTPFPSSQPNVPPPHDLTYADVANIYWHRRRCPVVVSMVGTVIDVQSSACHLSTDIQISADGF